MDQGLKLDDVVTDHDAYLTNVGVYQRLIGKLIYLIITRHDISFVVHVLSQFIHAPSESQFSAALKVLKYLKREPSRRITFYRNSEPCLRAFYESDWATCHMSHKSVTGYCIFFCSSLISFKSKKQSIVSRFSAEAEYRTMAQTCCEIIWIVELFKDLQIVNLLPVTLACNNLLHYKLLSILFFISALST